MGGPSGARGDAARAEVLALARRLAARPAGHGQARPDLAERTRRFIAAHPEAERERAAELLDLGRASWRLRDDDNLYLGRLERLLTAALDEAERRGLPVDEGLRPRAVTLPSPLGAAAGRAAEPRRAGLAAAGHGCARRRRPPQARQIVGQPAGPGLAVGAGPGRRGP